MNEPHLADFARLTAAERAAPEGRMARRGVIVSERISWAAAFSLLAFLLAPLTYRVVEKAVSPED